MFKLEQIYLKEGGDAEQRKADEEFFSVHHPELDGFNLRRSKGSWTNPCLPFSMATPDGVLCVGMSQRVGVVDVKTMDNPITREELDTNKFAKKIGICKVTHEERGAIYKLYAGHAYKSQLMWQSIVLDCKYAVLALKLQDGWAIALEETHHFDRNTFIRNVFSAYLSASLYLSEDITNSGGSIPAKKIMEMTSVPFASLIVKNK